MARLHIDLRKSSSFTLAVIFTVLLCLSICTLLYFMWLASDTNKRNEVEAIISTDMNGLIDAYRVGGVSAVSDILHYRLKHPIAGTIYILSDAKQHVVMGNFAYLPEQATTQGMFEFSLEEDSARTGLPAGKPFHILAKMQPLSDEYQMVVGRNLPDTSTKAALIGRLGWAMIAILALLAAAGFFISDRVVYRINLIADTATQIMQTGDLSRRIPVENRWDDLSVLAHILNQLFERVEALMQSVRQVSDNIAHDLRTPLTRIKNQLESLHGRGEQDALPITEYTDKLITDCDHLLSTFSALLRIGNIESGKWKGEYEQLSLTNLILDVVDFYEPLAADKDITIHMELAKIDAMLDKHLCFQAVANLVDNAIKYTPEGGDIYVDLRHAENDMAHLCVTDSGKGVSEDDYERIFSRFFRTDTARTTAGNGLGLSLVKAIITLHKGTIIARHNAQGFGIEVNLPKA